MIDDKRKLWLLISCNVCFATQKQQSDYIDKFVDSLNEEEVKFCLAHLGR